MSCLYADKIVSLPDIFKPHLIVVDSDQWKSDSRTKPYWQRLLERTEFPRYFPAIKTCLVADKKLYVQTYKEKDEKTEFYIFNINGKLEKKTLIPVIKKKSTGILSVHDKKRKTLSVSLCLRQVCMGTSYNRDQVNIMEDFS